MIRYSRVLVANAESGDAQAQYELGYCYYHGIGVETNKVIAVEWYTKAANEGNLDAQCELADCYYRGIGVTSSRFSEAIKWFERAAEQGSAYAYYRLGACYYYGPKNDGSGIGLGKKEKRAIPYWKKAAELGYTEAEYFIGSCYYSGLYMTENINKAEKLLLSAAKKGHRAAQYELGKMYRYWVDRQRYAAEWLKKAADQGDELAGKYVADCYFEGIGVEKDCAEALRYYRAFGEKEQIEECERALREQGKAISEDVFKPSGEEYVLDTDGKSAQEIYEEGRWYEEQGNINIARAYYDKAAGLGHLEALCLSGDGHWQGHGNMWSLLIKKNFLFAAKERYILAARADDTYACRMTGLCLEGIDETLEAVKWYKEAADCGDAQAQGRLGLCYLRGNGVAVNIKKGEEYLRRGADNGDPTAQYELGCQYRDGGILIKDLKSAVEYLEMGAEQGHALSCYDLGQCYEKGIGVEPSKEQALKWYQAALEGFGYITESSVKKAIKRVK